MLHYLKGFGEKRVLLNKLINYEILPVNSSKEKCMLLPGVTERGYRRL
jgi:hypothetical protein